VVDRGIVPYTRDTDGWERAGVLRSNAPWGPAIYPGVNASPPRTLWDVLAATANRWPDTDAIDDGECVLDYATLMRSVRQRGAALVAEGVGDRCRTARLSCWGVR
jgi:hypothetical protein